MSQAAALPDVIKDIERVDAGVVEQAAKFPSSIFADVAGRRGALHGRISPLAPSMRLAGPAVTVEVRPGDNLMIHAALDVCEPGDVLVVALKSGSTDGMFGELLAVSCRARGVLGLVIDAGVRDVAALEEMQFPVWAKAISAQGTVKATPGSLNVPVVCAGALVYPGDIIVADRDGVVCVRRADAEKVARLAAQRKVREDAVRERLRAGERGMDIYGFRAKFPHIGGEDGDGNGAQQADR